MESQRQAAASHRASVTGAVKAAIPVLYWRETGSFNHGTGVRNYSDVDLLASIKRKRPGSSDTALRWIKNALQDRFPRTAIRVSRPAVIAQFGNRNETWEIIPAFLTDRGGRGIDVYDIPGAAGGWMDTAPAEHLKYVNESNRLQGPVGGAKKLARLVKAWKYYNSVPISSFYLEMRAAQHMTSRSTFVPVRDICLLLESLRSHSLASMNDPQKVTGRFNACSSLYKKLEALSKLKTAATRARKALDAHQQGDLDTAFRYLDLLFGGNFPSRRN